VVVVAAHLGEEAHVEHPIGREELGEHEELEVREVRIAADRLESLEHESGWPNAVVICSMCRYPAHRQSTIVARTSRGSAFSSTSAPASAE